MEIKINSHPEGLPETGEASMGSAYYSSGGMIIRTNNSNTPSGCDFIFPLDPGAAPEVKNNLIRSRGA
jgi:hypothetical protein